MKTSVIFLFVISVTYLNLSVAQDRGNVPKNNSEEIKYRESINRLYSTSIGDQSSEDMPEPPSELHSKEVNFDIDSPTFNKIKSTRFDYLLEKKSSEIVTNQSDNSFALILDNSNKDPFDGVEKLWENREFSAIKVLSEKYLKNGSYNQRAQASYWISRVFRADDNYNNTGKAAIFYLKNSADSRYLDALILIGDVFNSRLLVPHYSYWRVAADDDKAEFYYKLALSHADITSEQSTFINSRIQNIKNWRDHDWIMQPGRKHSIKTVCTNSEYVKYAINFEKKIWPDFLLQNCTMVNIMVPSKSIQVVDSYFRGSQRSKRTAIVRVIGLNGYPFGFIDPP